MLYILGSFYFKTMILGHKNNNLIYFIYLNIYAKLYFFFAAGSGWFRPSGNGFLQLLLWFSMFFSSIIIILFK